MDGISSFRMAEELGAGVSALDRDHDDLLSLTQQLAKLHGIHDLPGAKAVLGELMCTAEAHWRREEDMLRRYGYPGTVEHARGHADAQDRLSDLFDQLPHDDLASKAEDAIVRLVIADCIWKWWFLDAGVQPEAS